MSSEKMLVFAHARPAERDFRDKVAAREAGFVVARRKKRVAVATLFAANGSVTPYQVSFSV
jgi:hypothetical protein